MFLISFSLNVLDISLYAQYNQLQFKHITVEDGLAQSVVNAIFKDSHGFVWMASYSGISRYDGIKVLSNDEIAPGAGSISQSVSIIEDADANIWIGSVEALIKFDYGTNRFYRYSRNGIKSGEGLKTKGYYFPIAGRDGKILCSTMVYPLFYIFDTRDESFTELNMAVDNVTKNILPVKVPPIAESFKDVLHFYYFDDILGHTVSYLEQNTEIGLHWVTKNIHAQFGSYIFSKKKDNIVHLTFLNYPPLHNLNINTTISTLNTYDLANEKIISQFDANYKINHSLVYDNKIFVGSESSGIHIIDQNTKKEIGHIRHRPNNPSSLMSDNVAFVAIFDNQLWISEWGKGVSYATLSPPLFTRHFSDKEAKEFKTNNFVRGIVEDKNGDFWCNTLLEGIVQLNQNLEFKQRLKGVEDINSAAIAIDKNDNLFFGSKGLWEYNINAKKLRRVYHQDKHLNIELTPNEFHYFSFDKNDRMLTAAMLGIYEEDRNINQLVQIKSTSKEFNELQQFVYIDRHDHLYAFSVHYGLNAFEKINGTYKVNYSFEKEFIPRHAYELNDSIIWFGTTSGLVKFNHTTCTETWYTKDDGLPDNTIYAIAPDKSGKLWLSTNRGISRFDPWTNEIKTFEDNPGQQGREYNRHAVCIARDGRILFGGINGITAVHPDAVQAIETNPVIQLTSVQNDVEINPFGHQSEDDRKILPAGSSFIEFHFIAIDFFRSNECSLKYFLEGADKSWRTIQNPGNARYVNLLPGKYVFKVLASDYNGNWTNEIKTFHFEIKKLWWQTLLFKIIMFVIAGSLIYLLIKFWLNQKLQAERLQLDKHLAILKEQERISADLHDDIGSTLSSISIYSELADKYYHTVPEKSQEMVQKISSQSKQLMSRIEDIIWSLKPYHQDKYTLKNKILEFAKESFDARNIHFDIKADENIDKHLTEPNIRKNLLLLLKEAINNIAKHSKASYAEIFISSDQQNIVAVVRDNGIGFDMQDVKKGNGLNNMKKRLQDIYGELSIISKPNLGTTIRYSIPFLNTK
jgi:signal transduction histidine kinase/ligand-binding sensor domain-containing protein